MSTVTAKCLVESAYAASSATTVYTSPAATTTIIDKFTATNTDSGAHTITVYLVPSGGTAGGSNTITSAYSIAAGTAVELTELKNHVLATGDFISAFADSASKVIIRASGRQIA